MIWKVHVFTFTYKVFPLPSETTSSGFALMYHSTQDPSYMAVSSLPQRKAARAMWQAVTPEPHVAIRGRDRSMPFSWNSFRSSSGDFS
ncbi:hypothetical protein GDO81_023595 [Engystomops pustulosus]|uniref:Uncharacterized protein n=1 Tax=Engystomops pustulosus TaxID=76066 RepID=A0AAV6YRX8_ENGPU|nr:hypothetical protein GDO81_023595 [Engystomops pustulosus]